MTAWTTPADLRAQVLRLWERDELLAATFPLRLVLRAPASADLSERFEAARAWAAEISQGARAGYRVVLRDVRHRVIGQNSLPGEAWVDTLDAALRLIGKVREGKAFGALLAATKQQPALLPWLARQPRRALALADEWSKLLAIVAWVQAHPRPGVYLRQVDVAGVHSKFIEAQRGVLAELLDLALPTDAINAAASGAAQFARRYGFRDKPLRVRLRFLDPRHVGWVPGIDVEGGADYTVSRQAFAALDPAVDHVFITENEINFLSFPALAGSLVVFGAGYGFDALAQAAWLQRRALHYWGDIDTHGFAILDQLRSHFAHAQSFLMDRDTLLAHRAHWVDEPQPTQRDLSRLSDPERLLYDDLRWRRLRDEPLRLEQERIAFGRVEQWAAALL